MIDFDRMAKDESVADVIAFLVSNEEGFGYPQMDRFFSRYNFAVISNGEFMRVFEQIRQSGIVTWDEKMLVKKGPNWKKPTFMSMKKYGVV